MGIQTIAAAELSLEQIALARDDFFARTRVLDSTISGAEAQPFSEAQMAGELALKFPTKTGIGLYLANGESSSARQMYHVADGSVEDVGYSKSFSELLPLPVNKITATFSLDRTVVLSFVTEQEGDTHREVDVSLDLLHVYRALPFNLMMPEGTEA